MSHREPDSREVIESAIKLAELTLMLARVKRVTQHADGEYESDTDHTVMLGIMAPAFAKEFASRLDTGKIAEFALVHELTEAYAGDTNTYGLVKEEEFQTKIEKEAAALKRIKEEFDPVFPWIGETIEEYERLDTPEARFVKAFDKILPKVTNILNGGSAVRALGQTKEFTDDFMQKQYERMVAGYAKDQPEAMQFFKAMSEEMLKEIRFE